MDYQYAHFGAFITILPIKLKMINQDRRILGDFSVNFKPISLKFCKAIFYSIPESPEIFVKLYSVFQKLDYLTCSKLT